jgi:hypothetical protein
MPREPNRAKRQKQVAAVKMFAAKLEEEDAADNAPRTANGLFPFDLRVEARKLAQELAGDDGYIVSFLVLVSSALLVLCGWLRRLHPARAQGEPITLETSQSVIKAFETAVLSGGLAQGAQKVMNAAALAHGISASAVRTIIFCFVFRRGTYYVTDTSGRGTANAKHPLRHQSIPDDERHDVCERIAEHVGKLIRDRLDRGLRTTVRRMRATARALFEDKPWKEAINARFVSRVMRMAGYAYGPIEAEFVSALTLQERRDVFRRFMLQYDQALKEEEAGTAIIVYIDESYIYSTHHARYGWHRTARHGEPAQRGLFPKKGRRVLIIHAATKDGFLNGEDPLNPPANVKDVGAFAQAAASAEGIFHDTTGAHKDYHKSFTGPLFVSWLKNRLIPSIEARYPGKKAYVVMDNAAYHHTRADGFFNPKAAGVTKRQVVDWLVTKRKIKSITFTKAGTKPGEASRIIELDLTKPDVVERLRTKNGSKFNDLPSRSQLDDLAEQEALKDGPHVARTQVQQALTEHNMVPIYLFPYGSKCNPIELMWGIVKNAVADGDKIKRTLVETITETRTAMYQKLAWAPGNPVAAATVLHAHKDVNAYLANSTDARLAGIGKIGKFEYDDATAAEVAELMKGYTLPLSVEGTVPVEVDSNMAPEEEGAGEAGAGGDDSDGDDEVIVLGDEDDDDAAGGAGAGDEEEDDDGDDHDDDDEEEEEEEEEEVEAAADEGEDADELDGEEGESDDEESDAEGGARGGSRGAAGGSKSARSAARASGGRAAKRARRSYDDDDDGDGMGYYSVSHAYSSSPSSRGAAALARRARASSRTSKDAGSAAAGKGRARGGLASVGISAAAGARRGASGGKGRARVTGSKRGRDE